MMWAQGLPKKLKGGQAVFRRRDWCSMLLMSLTVVILAIGSIGCTGIDGKMRTDLSQLNAESEEASGVITRERLRREVQRFARRYIAWIAQTGNEFQSTVATSADRREWQRYKIYMAATTVSIAAGEIPLTNLLDMMVFTRIAALRARELTVVPMPAISDNSKFNDATVKQFEAFDAEIWAIGSRVLKQEQLDTLDQLIVAWKKDNPDIRSVTGARFDAFTFDKGDNEEMELWKVVSGGVFSSIGLLPNVGDMTRAVDEARDFSERVLFYVEHLQFLLRWQSEYVVYETLAQPDVQALIANAGQLAQSSDRIAAVFENLPAHTERLELLLAEASRTLDVGGETALRVNEAALTISALFETGDESPDDDPFDVTEYGSAAFEIAAAAQQVTAAADALDRVLSGSGAEVKRLESILHAVSQIESEGEKLATWVFLLGVAFVLITLVACVAAGLTYKAVARALFGTSPSG
jgi:hypothetical protein